MTHRRLHRVLVAVPFAVTAVATPALVGASDAGSGREPGAERLSYVAAVDPATHPASDTVSRRGGGDPELLARGRELYVTGCSSCHGLRGEGVVADGSLRGPPLTASGEASAYYYLSTGRMPLASSEEQPKRKEPAYRPDEIEALVAYVATLGDGPALPRVDPEAGDLAEGGAVYRANCQACHGASGSGGALTYGRAAPRLGPATPTEIAAAVRIGPGEMPVFGSDVVTDDQLNGLVRYVELLDDPADPGGLPIGRTGPVAEGFVAWLIGMTALLGLVAWIGTRSPVRPTPGESDERASAGSARG
jgi:ubiquinol-cytochrome c reductase cytochrome c subunit